MPVSLQLTQLPACMHACPQDIQVQEPGDDDEEVGSSGQRSSKDIIDVEGFGYNENGSIVFDGGSYSTGPEFIGEQLVHRPAGPWALLWPHCLLSCFAPGVRQWGVQQWGGQQWGVTPGAAVCQAPPDTSPARRRQPAAAHALL
jgi:hypothetical protein